MGSFIRLVNRLVSQANSAVGFVCSSNEAAQQRRFRPVWVRFSFTNLRRARRCRVWFVFSLGKSARLSGEPKLGFAFSAAGFSSRTGPSISYRVACRSLKFEYSPFEFGETSFIGKPWLADAVCRSAETGARRPSPVGFVFSSPTYARGAAAQIWVRSFAWRISLILREPRLGFVFSTGSFSCRGLAIKSSYRTVGWFSAGAGGIPPHARNGSAEAV